MRLVLTAAAFIVGVVIGINYGLAPDGAIDRDVWFATLATTAGLAIALMLGYRNPFLLLLLAVVLVGIWRGSYAFNVSAETELLTTGLEIPGIESIRSAIRANLTSLFPGDAGALGVALLTGDRGGLRLETVDQFRGAGLSHLLAISGLHVAMVGGLAMYSAAFLFGKRGGWFLIPAAIAVLMYALLSGLAPPVTRAAIMFGVLVAARFSGRQTLMLPTLALAAVLMIALDPFVITSLSFQLSFAAMVGIAIVAPKLDALTEVSNAESDREKYSTPWQRLVRFVKGSLIVSVAATLATAPIVGLYFGVIPVWGILATLFALPAVPVVIVSTAVAAVVGSVTSTVLATWVALPMWLTSSYVIEVAAWFDSLPSGRISSISWTPSLAIGYYVVAGILFLGLPRLRSAVAERFDSPKTRTFFAPLAEFVRSTVPWWIATVLFLAAGVMWIFATAGTPSNADHLRFRFISVESGDSVWITTPNGNRMLIDAGLNAGEVADHIASLVGPFDNSIDLLVLTHPDADHVGGMPEVISRFDVGAILHTGETTRSLVFEQWQSAISGVENQALLEPGSVIRLDDGVFVEVVSAGCPSGVGTCDDLNNASAVLRIVYDRVSVLLTGDIEASAERRLVRQRQPIQSTVLKVPHHGSVTSSTVEFLDAVSPQVAIFTVGYGSQSDRFGHPDPEVYRRVVKYVSEPRAFRTDTQGTIEIITDGTRLWYTR